MNGTVMDIALTAEQKKAVAICVRRIRAREPVTRLFGYAGTGKTTIAQAIAQELGGRALFAAYTGKAAFVLTMKGCPAQTIHKLLYQVTDEEFVPEKRGIPAHYKPVFEFDPDKQHLEHSVLILDEVSMIDDEMAMDILSLGIPVLVIGDPAQLPPVKGDTGYFIQAEPDAMLTEVVRNEGRVLQLATDVRRHGEKVLSWPRYRDVVLPGIGADKALDFDQVLVGTNFTRHQKNAVLRGMKGYEDNFIVTGDRIMCLDNNSSLDVVNGQQFRVLEVMDEDGDYTRDDSIELLLGCECELNPSGSECRECGWIPDVVPVWVAGLAGAEGEKHLKSRGRYGKMKAMEATHGFAITVHKAQGSEWGNVLVINECRSFRKDRDRWLYTAITRARESVTIIPALRPPATKASRGRRTRTNA